MIIIHNEKGKYPYLHQMKPRSDVKLSFTRQEVFGNLILSLDKIRKRLMISDVLNPLKMITFIDLRKIRFVSIKKVYRDIQRGALGQGNLGDYLESMHFQFEFYDNGQKLYLPVFEKHPDDSMDTTGLEKKAVLWQLLLSKLKLQ